jgi:hypothetical protein
MNTHTQFALHRALFAHQHPDITAAHLQYSGLELSAVALKQGDGIARLESEDLHVSSR